MQFPEWLADNEHKLSADDYERLVRRGCSQPLRRLTSVPCSYGRQYQFFQQLVAVYETEPDNFPRLMELMQDVRSLPNHSVPRSTHVAATDARNRTAAS